jgi:hypothetical protein
MDEPVIRGSTRINLLDQVRWAIHSNLKTMAIVMATIAATTALLMAALFPSMSVAALILNAMVVFAVGMPVSMALMLFILAIGFFRLSSAQCEISYEVSPTGMTFRDPTGAAITIPWSMVRWMRENPHAFRFRLRPAGERYIRKRAFSDADLPAIRALGAAERLREISAKPAQ